MSSSVRAELEAAVGPVYFSDLRAHLARGAIIVVDPSLALVDVGVAVAHDDKEKVTAWIAAGLLRKPTLEELQRWEKITDPRWLSLIVAPFVLLQESE